MPRAPTAHSPPRISRKRRLTSQTSEYPWDFAPAHPQSEDPPPSRQIAKRPRLGRGLTEEAGIVHVHDARLPMTDPVEPMSRPPRMRSMATELPKARRAPTSENDSPLRPITEAAPVSGLQSPFQYRSRTSSASASRSSKSTSSFGSPESAASRRGRARTASLRAAPYPGAIRAPRLEKNVDHAGSGFSLMATLLSTPIATSTPVKSRSALTPPGDGAMDVDTLPSIVPWETQARTAKSASNAHTDTKGKGKMVAHSARDRRSDVPKRPVENAQGADDLTDMLSTLGLGESKWPVVRAQASTSQKSGKILTSHHSSHMKHSKKADGRATMSGNKLKVAAVGKAPLVPAMESKMKKENVVATKQHMLKRPPSQQVQSKGKSGLSIPVAVVKPLGRAPITPVSKAFAQRKRGTVWMKVNEQPLQIEGGDSTDELDAF